MEPTLDYQSAPYDFAHCFDSRCTCADKCLRHFLGEHIPAERDYVTTVNPLKVGKSEKSCPFFRPKKIVRLAVGMIHLYDNLNYRDAVAVKREISHTLGRGIYYRIRNGERPIQPGEQDYIRRVFRKHGITTEPVFDGYKEEYEW